jgi:hypothetical protein
MIRDHIATYLLVKLEMINGEIPPLQQVDFDVDDHTGDIMAYCYRQSDGDLCGALHVDNPPPQLDFRAVEKEMVRCSQPHTVGLEQAKRTESLGDHG